MPYDYNEGIEEAIADEAELAIEEDDGYDAVQEASQEAYQERVVGERIEYEYPEGEGEEVGVDLEYLRDTIAEYRAAQVRKSGLSTPASLAMETAVVEAFDAILYIFEELVE